MNELTQFINQKGLRQCGSDSTQLGYSLFFPFAFLFNQVSLFWWLFKGHWQGPHFTNDPKYNNIAILYNLSLSFAVFVCSSLYRDVRALCRVRGSTGTSAAESVSWSGALLAQLLERDLLMVNSHLGRLQRLCFLSRCVTLSNHVFTVEINIIAVPALQTIKYHIL